MGNKNKKNVVVENTDNEIEKLEKQLLDLRTRRDRTNKLNLTKQETKTLNSIGIHFLEFFSLEDLKTEEEYLKESVETCESELEETTTELKELSSDLKKLLKVKESIFKRYKK